MSTAAATRKKLDALLRAADERYTDLAVRLRRLRAELTRELPEGSLLSAAGVDFRTLAAGRSVPIISCTLYASRAVPDGAELYDESGAAVGTFCAETVLEAGGRWDSIRQRYTGEPAAAPLTYDLMESQVATAEWFAAWLKRWAKRQHDPRRAKVKDFRAMLDYGNRGGGKTELGLWLVLCAAVEVPESICWVISCSRPQSEEDVAERLRNMVPKTWGAYRGQPAYRWRLVNGSRIREMTGDSPQDLKQGRVDVAMLNEAAKMDRRAYAYPLGRVSDRGGLLHMTSNPPTPDVPKGAWVLDLHAEWEDAKKLGKWFPCHIIRSDGAKNAATDQGAREDVGILLRAVSPEIADADADGSMKPIAPLLFDNYDRSKHGMGTPPDFGDVTEAVTRAKFGRAYAYIAGVDYQVHPYIVASFWKLYGDVNAPILWCVSDYTVSGSEDDFLDEVILSGIPLGDGKSEEIDPGTVLWIGDSSAQWQDRKNRGQAALVLPPSFAYWRHRGLAIIPPTMKITPESRFAKNPPKKVSYGQVNRFLKEGRIMVSPTAALINEALAKCEAKRREGGVVTAEAKWSHAIDTVRYVAWWVDPPTRRSARGGTVHNIGRARSA